MLGGPRPLPTGDEFTIFVFLFLFLRSLGWQVFILYFATFFRNFSYSGNLDIRCLKSSAFTVSRIQVVRALMETLLTSVKRRPISPKYAPCLRIAILVLLSVASTSTSPYFIKNISSANSPTLTTKSFGIATLGYITLARSKMKDGEPKLSKLTLLIQSLFRESTISI